MNKKELGDRMRKFGAKIAPAKVRDYDYFVCCAVTPEDELPEKFMLPIDEWAAVRDQNGYNACVSFGITTAQEANHFKQTGEHVSWSPGYIYGNPLCRPNYSGEGMYTQDAVKGTMKAGFVPERYFDILTEMPEMMDYVKNRSDLTVMGETARLKGYTNLNYALRSKKISAMKQAIYTYRVPLIIASDRFFGGPHCVVVYGWDDTLEMRGYSVNDTKFAIRNSWGTGYKDGGNWYIPVSKIDEVYLPLFDDLKMPFIDVRDSDWFYNEVRAAVFSGLVQGVSETEFHPNGPMVRGDFALVISRLIEKLQDSFNVFIKTESQKGRSTQPMRFQSASDFIGNFTDMSDSMYYYDAVHMVCANGFMEGTGDGKFEPETAITRAEAAAVIVRFYSDVIGRLNQCIKGANLIVPDQHAGTYSDVSLGEWYYDYIYDAARMGLMHGSEDGTFCPNTDITRAEAAAVLNRLFKKVDRALDEIR